MTRIEFQHDGAFEVQDLSSSLLEISLEQGLPHIHACGGHGRCSTCRVMVLEGVENILPRNEIEARLARKKGLEPNIRLACQTRVEGPVRVRRLVIDREDAEVALAESEATSGRETQLAVLFADVRNFTSFSERSLPYDVIHVLNRYFRRAGEAILSNGGFIDKYMGDGLMALFGMEEEDCNAGSVCRAAVRSGLEMLESLEELNAYVRQHFDFSFEIGIGVHFGEALIGEMGHPKKMQFTALGDTVNTASRIETLCKKAGAVFLVSDAVYRETADVIRYGRRFRTNLRGKSGDYALYEPLGLLSADGGVAANGGVQLAPAGDLPQAERIALARSALRREITRDQAPGFLRLAYHDAADFDAPSGSGGLNASIRFPENYKRPENRGLDVAVAAIERAKAELERRSIEVSFADLIALAGALAVELCDGPRIPIALGRRDAEEAAEGPAMPTAESSFEDLVERFSAMGLGFRELVALSGAHTIGRAEGRPFTEDFLSFNNSYFRSLLRQDALEDLALLPTDYVLANREETRAIVEEYARDQERFFTDFTDAYRKLTRDGQADSVFAVPTA